MFDVPEDGGVGGTEFVQQFADDSAGGPGVVSFKQWLGVVRLAEFDDLAEMAACHGKGFIAAEVLGHGAAEDSKEAC